MMVLTESKELEVGTKAPAFTVIFYSNLYMRAAFLSTYNLVRVKNSALHGL